MVKTIVKRSKKSAFRKRRTYKRKVTVASLSKQFNKMKPETKCVQISGTTVARSLVITTSQAQFDLNCVMVTPLGAIIPSVPQAYPVVSFGTGNDQRVGDEIYIKSIYINWIASALPYSATTNSVPRAFLFTVFVVRPKRANTGGLTSNAIIAGANSDFFEYEDNTGSGLTGNLLDTLKKVDKDNYKVVYKKTYKMGYTGNLTSGNVPSTLGNNDFKQLARGRIKISMGKFKFNRLNFYEGQPYYMFTQCTPVDITSNFAATDIPASFAFNNAIYYTDS